MRAWILDRPAAIERQPLEIRDFQKPIVGNNEVNLQMLTCGICRTDLHIAEGDILPEQYPVIPGHQGVGVVREIGDDVDPSLLGQRRGIYWLNSTCDSCEMCVDGRENLCHAARFNGLDVPGGFAQSMVANADFTVEIPTELSAAEAAPLLCAGIIGYRSLQMSEVQPGERLALFGFGASAHIVAQVALHWGCEVVVYTRSEGHQRLAKSIGASWVGETGRAEGPLCDRAITFAPVGEIIPLALKSVRRGGTVAINAVSMNDIPSFSYDLLYGERNLKSVAHVTREDAEEFMQTAAGIPIRPNVVEFPFSNLNKALLDLKNSEIDGAAILRVSRDTSPGHG